MLVINGREYNLRKLRVNGRHRHHKEDQVARQKMEQYGTCCICDEPIHQYTYTIEHIIPFSRLADPRKFVPENIEASCARCNTGKKNKLIGEYQGHWMTKVKKWLKQRICMKQDIPDRADMFAFLFVTGIRGRLVVQFYMEVMEQEKAFLIAQIGKEAAD